MRPAYRYSLAALLVVSVFGAVALGLSASNPRRPPPGPGPLAPPGAERRLPKVKAPARPSEAVPEVLDELQVDEAHELGPDEAARRREVREQLIRARSGQGVEAGAGEPPR